MSGSLNVDFTNEDWTRLVQTAEDRGYNVNRGGRGLADYVRDCALGKFEPRSGTGEGQHVRLALLVWALATETWTRAPFCDECRRECEKAFWDTLGARVAPAIRLSCKASSKSEVVLADAADEGRLG